MYVCFDSRYGGLCRGRLCRVNDSRIALDAELEPVTHSTAYGFVSGVHVPAATVVRPGTRTYVRMNT